MYWVFPADELAALMDAGEIRVQHAMSDTKWFFPSRTGRDPFSEHRLDYAGLNNWLLSLCR